MKKINFEYQTKLVVNKPRNYPLNKLAELFLELMQTNHPKSFTKKQLGIIEQIGNICKFEMECRDETGK